MAVKKLHALALLLFANLGLLSSQALAEETKPDENPVKINGFVDTYYSLNLNMPGSRSNQLRNFDIYSNQFGLNAAQLSIQKDGPVGFKTKLLFGSTADFIQTIDGKVDEISKNIQEAYGSVAIPINGNDLMFNVGKFATHMGSEVIETNANWNYSRSNLFAWAIPYTHTGIRANYSLNKYIGFHAAVVNGWNRIVDNNDMKTFCGQVMITPMDGLTLYENVIGGPEQADNNNDWRFVSDTILNWQIMPSWAVNLNFDYGMETVNKANNTWMGFSGMTRYAITDNTAVALRGEWFNDPDGLQTGTKQQLTEGTLTLEYRPIEHLILRAEGRYDQSTAKVFDSAPNITTTTKDAAGKDQTVTSPTKVLNQTTFLVGAVFEF